MRVVILVILLFLSIGCNREKLIKVSDEEKHSLVLDRKLPEPNTIEILDVNNREISVDSMIYLQTHENYVVDFYKKNGEIIQARLRVKNIKDH